MNKQMIEIKTVSDLEAVAQIFTGSEGFKGLALSEIKVRILAGIGYGVSPFDAVRGIYIVQGQPQLKAGLAAAILIAGGYRYQVIEKSKTRCEIKLFHSERGFGTEGLVGTQVWTIDDAKDAGLAGKDNWRKYTRQMLFARCMTEMVNTFAANLTFGSVYSWEHGETEIPSDGQGIMAIPEKVQSEHIERDITPEPAQDEPDIDDLEMRMKMMKTKQKHFLANDFKSAHGIGENDPFPMYTLLTDDDKMWIETWFLQNENELDGQFKQAVAE